MARTKTANIVSFEKARKTRYREEVGEREGASSRALRRREREGASSREADRRAREGMSARELRRREREELDSRELRRRERAKARAGKMYSRQFAESDDAATASGEGAPRPALYETKMGSTHRKSARMQRSSSAGSASAKVDPAGWFSSLKVDERVLKVATGALCVLLTCMFLYVPAQQYYQAQRERDRLAAEYDMIEKRNDVLDVQNDILASDAGMEDAVRQKYGYVKLGEETAVVTGLSDSATDMSRGSDGLEANVLSSSVKSPEEWYTPLLDTFFGVE